MPAGTSAFSGNVQKVNGVIKAEDVKLFINDDPAEGAVIQQAQWSCERTVNMLYEIGTQNVYYVGDRRKGNATFSRVVAGARNFGALVTTYGNLCNADTNTMRLQAGSTSCGTAGAQITYNLLGVTLQNLGASVTANDIVITENMTFMFVDMEYTVV